MHGMFGSRPSFAAFSVSARSLAQALVPVFVLVPSIASAATHSAKPERTAHATVDRDPAEAPACRHAKPEIEFVAGSESATFSLEKCDGEAIPASIDKLSVLARPANAAKPGEPLADKAHGVDVAPGIRRIDARLVERLELFADHFRKEGETPRIVLVAPKSRSAGSYHASGRAIDFRVDGTDNDALVAFCKKVQDTGCGYYPNGGFVHMDVRDAGAGHVAWIDVSKPGESPKYVTAWPLPSEAPKAEAKAEAKADAKETKADAKADKVEGNKETERAEASRLPSLPAAVTAVPLDVKVDADPEPAPAPAKKARKRHHRHHDHTI
jgi:Bacterial protein of unknown function (DUF882)